MCCLNTTQHPPQQQATRNKKNQERLVAIPENTGDPRKNTFSGSIVHTSTTRELTIPFLLSLVSLKSFRAAAFTWRGNFFSWSSGETSARFGLVFPAAQTTSVCGLDGRDFSKQLNSLSIGAHSKHPAERGTQRTNTGHQHSVAGKVNRFSTGP